MQQPLADFWFLVACACRTQPENVRKFMLLAILATTCLQLVGRVRCAIPKPLLSQCDAMRVCLGKWVTVTVTVTVKVTGRATAKDGARFRGELPSALAPAEFQLNAHKLKISNNSGTRTPNKTLPNTQSRKKEEHTGRKIRYSNS